ncbi:aminotransferase class I/II-fold pyridoxal phosphate-dependent enzyme [Clostridioides sp. ES-S-0005-03]|uniref:aminotransferase class I/II-fold pyridoxal phosphate-dependent enzyme n=1 Tax=unclassified Clostridioides TaxID=2635829 RepID=UPI001D113ABF|nr:aminotransferase class I/II-fold pyridoxal phosphate-dependent enzyme [Clostridioides sp. ES-S-0005-03]MCC0704139.1 aminotransferase class I/II-fold pyridoxal phosphate-dependent enzyme [Clostridioides sp. ES-S-0049-02]UDN48385.1 aminotransferase class I/II-fold pyridoxal phosphate-dependent enzyme [Clostridioides sp. ES-S-0173-01]
MDSEFANAVELSYECAPLLESLKEYSKRDIACFDVPGHVKNRGVDILNKYLGENLMKMDINSSPTMDNVSNPTGVIKNAQDLLAQAYMADEAFFITNGTTQAIHAMILSVINPGEKVLLPRNIHKSVINALILCGGIPIFIQPEFDEQLGISLNITIDKVKEEIEKNCDIKALFLLNPTYYGACADLESIIELCHKNNLLVLVDEAHGAHFPFHLDLPPSAISLGADMVAVSIHKTGGALTQSSALLLNRENIRVEKVLQSINMLQSTSASYLLMASIDGARVNLVENGEEQLSKALNLSRYAKARLNKIDGIDVLSTEILKRKGVKFIDETKLCINVKGLNLTGFEVYDLLYKKFSIQVELGDLYNILALVSIGTNKSDIDRLVKALSIIEKNYRKETKLNEFNMIQINPTIELNPREAFYASKESIDIKSCIGRICGESIMAYPPGIPIVTPGELITKEIMEYIVFLKKSNAYLTDMQDKNLDTILVIK